MKDKAQFFENKPSFKFAVIMLNTKHVSVT